MTTIATVATREKWRRMAPAKCLVSSATDPTPINKMSAGRPPSQTLKASRCAMAAASPIHRGSSVVGWLAKGTTAWPKPAAAAATKQEQVRGRCFPERHPSKAGQHAGHDSRPKLEDGDTAHPGLREIGLEDWATERKRMRVQPRRPRPQRHRSRPERLRRLLFQRLRRSIRRRGSAIWRRPLLHAHRACTSSKHRIRRR